MRFERPALQTFLLFPVDPAHVNARTCGTPGNFDEEASGGYFVIMKTVGLKALKNNLSNYVRAAAAGETVRITDRDRVVAELRAPGESLEGAENPLIAEAILQGHIRPVLRSYRPAEKETGAFRVPLEQILRDLERDREDK